jgi:hypothetical protein
VLIAILWLVFNPTFRTAVRICFRTWVRFFASWVVETDPIGILRNNLDDMKKAKFNLDQTLQRFAGSDERLQRSIAAKNDEITTLGHKAAKASRWRRRRRPDGEGTALSWKARPSSSRPGC